MLEKIGIGILTILTKVVSVFSKEAWERLKNKRQNSKSASHDYNSPYKKRHGQLQASCVGICLLYTSPSPRDRTRSRMPSSA